MIRVDKTLHLDSAYSARNSNISSNNNSTYYFLDAKSGYGATLTCNEGHICNIACWLVCNGSFVLKSDYPNIAGV